MSYLIGWVGAGYAVVIAAFGVALLLRPRDSAEVVTLEELAPELFQAEEE